MEIKEMDMKDIQNRMTEIQKELEGDCDVDALTAEFNELEKRANEIKADAEKRKALMDKVASGTIGKVIESHNVEERKMDKEKVYGVDSPEYRAAWEKWLTSADMTDAEQRTLTTGLTADQHVTVPTTVVNEIWDLVFGDHSLLADLNTLRANTVVDIIKHTESSGASQVDEGKAPSEETNTFAKVTLAGKDYAKYVDISYAMERMSISALIPYIETEIAKAMRELMTADAIAAIEKDINANNKVSTTELSYDNMLSAFGSLKRVGNVVIYCTRKTLYTNLMAIKDSNKRPIFQAPAAGAPLGSVFGAQVKIEDGLGDNKILIGDGSKVMFAVIQDVMLESDKDIKAHVTTYSAYARAEAALIDDKAFAEITVTAAA